ncbi:beta strand repeat-containing protein [Hymenobacter convexus]|uniref:beta strand repeat-containing protein n=1 Tax=Hymenobacter sp. CA1UV-4 TaxID=3063782 RepID=UPI002712C046|nr:T9SS type A sorting domain-containing protein [Hymenobacter sp. CA1UV-4]MDO7851083.1 T9SS type A sorting domain-containing protein [Hymenobacter sp. CA1UV-4]
MHTPFLSNRLGRWLAVTLLALMSATTARAQLTGTKTIPGDYTTVAAAITALNTGGVGAGGVTFNIAAGYTETLASPTAGAITATGTSANPIVFQKSGAGANPVITAGVGTTTGLDAIISLAGSDYVTFNGIDVAENSANTTATSQMEFGYALFRPSATDGCQNNTIRNCVVTLNKTNAGTIGIAGLSNPAGSTTTAAATATSGANSGNKIYGNVVTNALIGINFAANSSTTTANYDQNNEIGSTTAGTGNTVGNFGGSASGWGAGGSYQNGLRIIGNTINSTLNYTSATASTSVAASTVTSTLRGIYCNTGTSSNLDVTGNTVTIASGSTSSVAYGMENSMGSTPASNTVNLTNNTFTVSYLTATTGNVAGIFNSGSPATLNITGNTFSNFNLATTGTTYVIYNNHSATAANVLNNTASGLVRTGSSGTVYGYYNNGSGAGTHTLTGNVFNNFTLATSGTFYGIYNTSSASETQLYSANQITNITSSSTATLYGINCSYGASGSQIFNNTITGLSSTGTLAYGLNLTNTSFAQVAAYGNVIGGISLSGAATIYGIYTTVTTPSYYRNKIYDLSATGSGTCLVYGLYTGGGTTILVHNNLIGNLTAPASTSLLSVNGLYFSSGTTINAYYNTVYLNASSTGATFGTTGLYFSATPTTVDARNNLVVNTSTAAGTGGYTAALRRSSGTAGTVPTNYATTSNNNLYYAGTPSATNLIYVEGTTTATNAQQTLASFKALMANRDQASISENAPFASTTGSAATFLHIAAGTPTQIESGAQPLASITIDFDGDTRNATTPDIGADEGTFTQAIPIVVSSVAYTQNSQTTAPSQTNQQVLGLVVNTTGQAAGAALNSATFNVGSTSLSNISNPRLYVSASSTFSLATATLVPTTGTLASPTFTLTLTTPATLLAGSNYYFLTYDIPATATVGATVATTATAVNVSGTTFTPTLSGAAGSRLILGPLSGTYYITATVGSSPDPTKEFATLTAAAAAYSGRPLASAVTFVLRDASYSTGETFPIAFNANTTASATNTLTIQPAVTSAVTGSSTTALIQLNGASYVTLNGALNGTGTTRDLTLTNNGSGGAVVQVIAGTSAGATNNALRNLNLLAQATTSGIGIAAGGAAAGSTGADNDNLVIQNNSIQRAYIGIYVGGTAAVSAGGTDGLVLADNVIGGATSGTSNVGIIGTFIANAVSPSVTNNTVQNIGLGATAAVGLTIGMNFPTGVSGATVTGNTVNGVLVSAGSFDALGLNLGTGFSGVVDRNRILNVASYTDTYGGHGIDVNTGSATSNLRLSNNFVAGINGAGWTSLTNDGVAGIRLLGTTGGVSLYHNSVSLTGTNTRTTTSNDVSAAIYVATGVTALDIRNNVFSNTSVSTSTGTPKSYAFYSTAARTAYTTLNYNDYYVAGTQGVLGNLAGSGSSGTATTDLVALGPATTANTFQNATTGFGQDANSLSVEPQFVSTTDLHSSSPALNNAGTPIASVTVDIDNQARSTTTPDIGADEFTPVTTDVTAVALVAPAATSTCYGTAEAVTVSIRNSGAGQIDFAANPATITVLVTLPGGATQTLTGTLSTGTLASGATVNISTSNTLNMSTAGAYSFAITATVQGDQNAANNTLATVTRTVAAPVVGALAPAASSICISGTATLTVAGAANGIIQFQSSTDGTTFTDIAGANSATYTTPVLNATTYYRAQVRCNTAVATTNVSTITVNSPQVASTNGPVAICAGSTATLTATASAGSSVRFFSAATGGTALASTAGSYTTPALTANTTYYAEAFTGGTESVGPTALTSTGLTAQTAGALYFTTTAPTTIQSVTVYLAAGQAAGTVTIDLRTGSSTSGAVVNGQSTAFAVPANTTTGVLAYVVPLNYTVPAAGAYTLYLPSATQGGVLRDNAGANITGYPFTSPSGTVSITGASVSGFYYYFYNWQLSSECANSTRTAIAVNVTQPATASFAAATGSSCGTSAVTLAGAVGGSATGGTYTSSGTGTFSPNATTLTATYTPSAADVAAGSVTITLTSSGSTPCPAATASFALSISPAPVATFSYPAATTYCAGSASTVSPTLGSGATAGTFSSTTGLTIDATTGAITLSSSTAGTYTVTNTVAASGTCAAVSATTTVTIAPATSAAFSYSGGTFCLSGTNPVATITGTTGGTFSSTTGLTINAATGAIALSSSTAGTYVVTYTVAGACGTSSTQSVTITAAPVATFSYGTGTPTFCVSGTTNPAPTFGAGASAGTFSSTTGLTINATTGAITLSSSTPGTYTVTNVIAAGSGCAAATATAQVTITAAPVATFGYGASPTFCVSGTTAPAVVLGTGATAGTFSSTAGLTINATTGAITLSTSTPGTYTVTNTVAAAGGCAATTATTSVTITAAPLATFSYGTGTPTFCVSGTTNPVATLGTGATAGTFTSTTGLTINATTGAITLSSSTPGTYTVTNTVAASGGCAAATATASVTITAAPAATFSYATSAGCVGSTTAVTPTLGTGASAGTFSSTTGLTIDATTGAITLSSSTAGTYTVTNTVAASGGCAAATATTTFTVNPRPATPTITATYNGTTTTLTSSATTGNQWYLGPNPVTGATGQTLVLTGLPSQLGSYTVTTTNANGCVSLPSNPLVVTSAKSGIAGSSLRLYPNPTPTGQVTLELTGYRVVTQLSVLDALGRVVASEVLPANNGTTTHALDLSGMATGVYLLRLSNANGVETRRLVRE